MCDPMTYPLLFPTGDNRWHLSLPYSTTTREERERLYAEDEENVDIDKEDQHQARVVIADPQSRDMRGEQEVIGKQAEAPECEPEEDDDNDPDVPNATRTRGKRQKISQLEYYSSLLQDRPNQFNNVLAGGILTQKFMVDSYIKIESNRINYLRENQSDLHVARYKGLTDYLNTRADRKGLTIGTAVFLPSRFIGSPRAQKPNYQGALCMTGKFTKPTLFLTMTCNPKCPKIVDHLCHKQSAADLPNLVARVFNLKLKALIEDIEKEQVRGQVRARIHVIEFQKRGLLHCQLLIWIGDEDVPKTNEQLDGTISADIPDKVANPKLHAMVMAHMIHGPCGKTINKNSLCMDGGTCTKRFPKEFRKTYRRREQRPYTLKRGGKEYIVYNTWIIPYNRYLLLKYDCRMNLEFCASINIVKYVFKYVYKGHDCADIKITKGIYGPEEATLIWDEISSFQYSRYVSAPEACWRILRFPMSYRYHAIIRLAVHLPLEQSVFFEPRNPLLKSI